MRQETYKDYEFVYQCPKHGCEIRGVVYPPAYCPICGKPTYQRHWKYYSLFKEHCAEPLPANYVDYTRFFTLSSIPKP